MARGFASAWRLQGTAAGAGVWINEPRTCGVAEAEAGIDGDGGGGGGRGVNWNWVWRAELAVQKHQPAAPPRIFML